MLSKKIYKFFLILIFILISINIYAKEIKIISKINNEIITNIDLENHIKYLLITNSNLKDLNKKGSKVWWRGFQYENYDYYKQPWERQAYRKQETVNKAWKKYLKTRKRRILTIDVK